VTADSQPDTSAATVTPRPLANIAGGRLASRGFALTLLAIAIVLGAWLRFAAAGAREMSADEGASWAAASAPGFAQVVRIQAIVNPGKLALYEILLHGWMRLFGDGIGAMRALSALLDTFSILVVFALVRELFGARAAAASQGEGAAFGGIPYAEADAVAAIAALFFAVNLVTIKYARELRMYPLALLIVLLQVWVFVRAVRRGRLSDLASLALLTALAVGAHFSAAFVAVAETLCLPALPTTAPRRARTCSRTPRVAIVAALGVGAMLFSAVALPALRTGASAFAHGATAWIEQPRWWAPLTLFNKAVGSLAFPAMLALAGWGAWRGLARARAAVAFALAWMWLPPLLMLMASYAFAPMFVERYALWCFVPFFALAALGAWEMRAALIRGVTLGAAGTLGAVGLSVALALGHIHAYRRRPHDTQWREAALAAAGAFAPGMKIAVAPPYAINVVRYYLRDTPAAGAAVPADGSATDVLIAGEQWKARDKAAKLLARYAHSLADFRGVRVYGGGTSAKSER
jgi:4-amino-4-deoxy-L-arabinose transferase-like glycosyltransferase